MRGTCVYAAVGAVLGLMGTASTARAQQTLASELIASGLTRPLFVTAPSGDNSRIFVVEQRSGSLGRVRIVNIPANTLNATPYLQITVSTGSEQGLLGLAFHPNFLQNGYFFVNYTRTAEAGVSAGSTIVARYRANLPYATSGTADAASAVTLLTIPQPDANHNGGWIAFGPDGYLYIATGDGGCGNDTNCAAPNPPSIVPPGHVAGGNAQSITANLLGKMLRIDVDGADNVPGNDDDDGQVGGAGPQYTNPSTNPYFGATAGLDEIFAHGLRNPWRPSIDRQTGDFWIADVGQSAREEVNFVPAGSLAGRNFGWRCMEGLNCTGLSGCTCNAANLTLPVLTYPHSGTIPPTTINGCSITGGYVYRGNAIPCFKGNYLFADYCTPQIWSFRRTSAGALTDVTNRTAQLEPPGAPTINNIMSFGEDAAGEVYWTDQTGGEVFKIVLGTSTGPDCNQNGAPDSCDIANGVSQDGNGNGIPDECECDPDVNCDGAVNGFDIQATEEAVNGDFSNFCQASADLNGDGAENGFDVETEEQRVNGAPC
ncbi:Quinoprotein glucose dehydrogenase B [Phycisphaerales bacterium]|nr:Quinoprotein glucose dehydrogenase B [Phycisphaerales bacterium]